MNFIEKILDFLVKFAGVIVDGFTELIDFLAKPLSYLLEFLIGIFYFIMKLFEVAIEVVMIFVAMFQFLFAIIAGVLRTAKSWLVVNPDSGGVAFPSSSYKGFEVVIDLVQPTGLLTVVPSVCLGMLWFGFMIKIIGLFGGTIMVTPIGRSSNPPPPRE